MPRRWQRPSGGFIHGKPRSQLISMITLLIVLGLIYARARDPQTWRWLAQDANAGSDADEPRLTEPPQTKPTEPSSRKETIVVGPTDLDPDEAAEAQKLFAAISDKAKLEVAEMPAYWRLMKWALAQSFDDLARRARRNVLFTQLWEQPERYRGQPLRLRLHIKRVVEWEKVASNPAGVERVFEAWGWTEDSKSYPYVVVFSELPAGMPLGADVQAEGVFVGYFLKIMTYDAFEKKRAAPLLIGRIRALDRPTSRPAGSIQSLWYWLAGGGILLLIGIRTWLGWIARRRGIPANLTRTNEETIEGWLSQPPATEPPAADSRSSGATSL